MHISKPVLLGAGLLGAVFVGWMLHMTAAVASAGAPSASTPRTGQYAAAPAASEPPPPPVYVTIVAPDRNTPVGQRATTEGVVVSRTPAHQQDALSTETMREVVPHDVAGKPAPGLAVNAAPLQVDGLSVIANGNDIVIASNGAIVSVGDNTVVHGNTGDASASGTIGLDVASSNMTSGDSRVEVPATLATPDDANAEALQGPEAAGATPPSVGTSAMAPRTNATVARRATAIAGYDVRSINTDGDDNLVTYDDSNLFFHRVGNLNGNTGDTDASGLNVVDAARSTVLSGNSTVRAPVTRAPATPGVVVQPTPGTSASVADSNGYATATGDDTLVIGGSGVNDRGVNLRGNHNAVTYHDGNAAIGGRGDVNSQIGDSANGGTVAMKVTDSIVSAGDALPSTNPISQ
jgi:hypothetical protein